MTQHSTNHISSTSPFFADASGAYHLCDASIGEDVAGVDEAIQHLSCLLDQVTLVGIVLQLLI